jgi:hypothetical protein
MIHFLQQRPTQPLMVRRKDGAAPIRNHVLVPQPPLWARCCCGDCLQRAVRARNNRRRRVRHESMACVVCGTMFVPNQSTARTCGNVCRQRLFRQRKRKAAR